MKIGLYPICAGVFFATTISQAFALDVTEDLAEYWSFHRAAITNDSCHFYGDKTSQDLRNAADIMKGNLKEMYGGAIRVNLDDPSWLKQKAITDCPQQKTFVDAVIKTIPRPPYPPVTDKVDAENHWKVYVMLQLAVIAGPACHAMDPGHVEKVKSAALGIKIRELAKYNFSPLLRTAYMDAKKKADATPIDCEKQKLTIAHAIGLVDGTLGATGK
ncbi:hypothetical protein [Telmatospirillum sp.]|uniref:hypothetical protein n=1 Tax=Telmatospirillum sp. TaxID=2079197 RepID=UPI00284A76DC|nr:hypothetical protein [Telmatospirillum sp.]MDR3438024.1 hypothetical protein [Telmatospirillum sp.]